jgi:hypothetical protein
MISLPKQPTCLGKGGYIHKEKKDAYMIWGRREAYACLKEEA